MNPVATPVFTTPTIKRVAPAKPKVNPETERYTEDIRFLKQYAADLRNGKLVENIHPENDKWFLIPENIEIMIEGMESAALGKGRVVNPENIWEDL